MIEKYIQALKDLASSDERNLAGADTVLGMLYECYNEKHPCDNEEIKADFLNIIQRNTQNHGKQCTDWQRLYKLINPLCGDSDCRDISHTQENENTGSSGAHGPFG